MKISIIIPCYNVEKYIIECLDSVINQSIGIDALEIIAIDDHSFDNTCNIISSYEKKYPDNIIFIPIEEHIGRPGVVRNIAMSYASGDYIIFLDSDDMLHDKYVEVMLDAAARNNSDVVSCGYIMFNSDRIIGEDLLENVRYNCNSDNDRQKLICNEGTRTPVWARIYRRKFLLDNNILFPETLHIAEDMFFWHCCMFAMVKSISIEDSLYKYRIKEDSLFHTVDYNYAMDVIECVDLLSNMFVSSKDHTLFEEEYGAVIFKKCGYELLDYLDTHVTTDGLYTTIISSLRSVLRKYWGNISNNKYLNNEDKKLADKLIG